MWQSASLADLSRAGWHWLALVEHEMMLFASVWFAIFAIDELLVDAVWLWLRLRGRTRSQQLRTVPDGELAGLAAVLVPAWSEAHVIGAMIARAFAAWPQKTRWVHGIAFQGWERMGWPLRLADLWMRLRDRRGPLVAMAMAVAYALVLLWPVLALAESLGLAPVRPRDPLLAQLLLFNLASLLWRLGMRGMFTAREYGWREGLLAMLRLPVGNVIAIMSTRRAMVAYLGVLTGGRLRWEHTIHRIHPFQADTKRLGGEKQSLDPLGSGMGDRRAVAVGDRQRRDLAIAAQ